MTSDERKLLKSTERDNRRLREMLQSLSELQGRAVFRVEMGTTEDDRLQFTVTSSGGAEMEKTQAAVLGGVIMALNHHWKAEQVDDEDVKA